MGQQAPAAGPPAQAQAAASPGNGAGRLFYMRGIFRERGANPRTLGRLDNPRPRGQGGGKSFQQPRRRPSDSLTEISANLGEGICFFKTAAEGQAGRHLLDVLDVLQSSAAYHAAAGRPRARSATTGGRMCRPGALEPSKVNAPRRRIPGNAAISPAGTAGEIGKSKHPSGQETGTAHAGRPRLFYGFSLSILGSG